VNSLSSLMALTNPSVRLKGVLSGRVRRTVVEALSLQEGKPSFNSSVEETLGALTEYHLVRKGGLLGEGSFGSVYASTVSSKHTDSAIFAVKYFRAPDQNVREAHREATNALLFKHAHVCKVVGWLVHEKSLCLVMPNLSGTLGGMINAKRRLYDEDKESFPWFPANKIMHIFSHLCRALAYLHGLNPAVAHRDIACDNCFVYFDTTLAGNPLFESLKLGDLGTVEARESDRTTPFKVVSKANYCAPELEKKFNTNYPVTDFDELLMADVFASGRVLFSLLTSLDLSTRRKDFSMRLAGNSEESGWAELVKIHDACVREDPTQRPTALELEQLVEGSLRDVPAEGAVSDSREPTGVQSVSDSREPTGVRRSSGLQPTKSEQLAAVRTWLVVSGIFPSHSDLGRSILSKMTLASLVRRKPDELEKLCGDNSGIFYVLKDALDDAVLNGGIPGCTLLPHDLAFARHIRDLPPLESDNVPEIDLPRPQPERDPGGVRDADVMADELCTEFPDADRETVINMLNRLAGNEDRVREILAVATSPASGPDASAQLIAKRLHTSDDFVDKSEVKMMKFAELLSSDSALCEHYFKLEDLEKFVDSGDDTIDFNAAQTSLQEEPLTGSELMERLKSMWRVKVILTTMQFNTAARVAGRAIFWNFDYGMVHAAIQVGPVILEWGPSSVVIPELIDDFKADHVVLALDVGNLDGSMGFVERQRISNLCKCVVAWNCGKSYDVTRHNCQDFVNACLRSLDIKTNLTGEISSFLRSLTGQNKEGTRFKFKGKVFKSHRDLDHYLDAHWDELQAEDRADDLALLKAFDRAFWIRHRTLQDNLDESPEIRAERLAVQPAGSDGCRFGDPSKTGTFMAPTSPTSLEGT
jgi:serine/threonine protein kinase